MSGVLNLFKNPCFTFTPGKPSGYDRVRNAEIGNKVCHCVVLLESCLTFKWLCNQDFELDVLEEAYTTEHWIVRIYKVKDLNNRGA